MDKKETFELPVDERGAVSIPDELMSKFQPAIERIASARIGEARTKTRLEMTEELRRSGYDPVERERLTQLEAEKKAREIADLEREKKYEEAQKLRDERHQKDLTAKDEAIQKRELRIRKGLQADIRAAALRHGARDESLDELARLLSGDLDLDPDLEPFVKGSDGKPAIEKDGQPVSIEGYVKAYLDTHTHHRKAPAGQGGGARGGASFAGSTSDAASRLAALNDRIRKGDASPTVMQEFLKAQREVQTAAGKGA